MMESYSLFKFAVKREFSVEGQEQKSLRLYQFELQPGSPWDEIQSALDEFKSEMLALQDQAKAKQEADAAAASAEPLEAEIVA
jgi:hypothetical protein